MIEATFETAEDVMEQIRPLRTIIANMQTGNYKVLQFSPQLPSNLPNGLKETISTWLSQRENDLLTDLQNELSDLETTLAGI